MFLLFLPRYLYWTTLSQLYRSSLAGQNVETVFSVSCASGLAINTRLYWTEDCAGSSTESVHSLDLSTLQESIIVENNVNHFYSDVAVYEDTVYWTGLGRVYSAPVAGGGNTTELLYIPSYGGTSFRGIVVVHPDLQPDPRITVYNPYLLFSTWFTVSAMNVNGSDYSVLVDSGSVGPRAVDYHWR